MLKSSQASYAKSSIAVRIWNASSWSALSWLDTNFCNKLILCSKLTLLVNLNCGLFNSLVSICLISFVSSSSYFSLRSLLGALYRTFIFLNKLCLLSLRISYFFCLRSWTANLSLARMTSLVDCSLKEVFWISISSVLLRLRFSSC